MNAIILLGISMVCLLTILAAPVKDGIESQDQNKLLEDAKSLANIENADSATNKKVHLCCNSSFYHSYFTYFLLLGEKGELQCYIFQEEKFSQFIVTFNFVGTWVLSEV